MSDLTNNLDYQDRMSLETRSVDTIGEQAAAETNATTAPVGVEAVKVEKGNATYSRTVGTFGVLPDVQVSAEHAHDRHRFFKELAAATGSGGPGARSSLAFKKQTDMAAFYLDDIKAIENAQRAYDLLVPLTGLAAKSFAKTHSIGEQLGFSDLVGAKLDAKQQHALAKASHGHELSQELNLGAAVTGSGGLISARKRLDAAALAVAAAVRSHVVDALIAERAKAKGRKAEIEAKIAKAKAIVGYVEKAGATIAGVAGAAVAPTPKHAPPPDVRDPASSRRPGLSRRALARPREHTSTLTHSMA